MPAETRASVQAGAGTAQGIAEEARSEGFTPLQAALLATRLDAASLERAGSVARAVAPPLALLDPPWTLPDLEPALARLVRARDAGERVVLALDHDADGVTAGAALVRGLVRGCGFDAGLVQAVTTDKLAEGYGISDAYVGRILALPARPSLLVTADQGSCDAERIARLAAAGVDVIVTDHHGMREDGPPRAAVATVNPIRADGRFPDRSVAGCHVAWLVVAALRARLREAGRGIGEEAPAALLDLTALGTVCDCVSLRSLNNRAVIRAGLARINGPAPRPAWRALAQAARRSAGDAADAQTLGWLYGPRMNASGRLASAMPGLRLLLSADEDEALVLARELEEANAQRRVIQQAMLLDATDLARPFIERGDPVPCLWLPDGHPGVQGIVASHMVRATGRAVICLAPVPRDRRLLTGSMRAPPGIHAKRLLDAVAADAPGLLVGHGGHAGAAGLRILADDYDRLCAALTAAAARIGARAQPPQEGGELRIRGTPGVAMLDEIEALAPYGVEWPEPRLEGTFTLTRVRVTRDGRHLQVELRGEDGGRCRGVWFGAGERAHALPAGKARVVFRLGRDTWRGTGAQMLVEDMREAP